MAESNQLALTWLTDFKDVWLPAKFDKENEIFELLLSKFYELECILKRKNNF